jgi:putative cardiolipin synthase
MKDGTESFARLARKGVQVRVLTNSLSATDVAPVHAGYSKRRKDLLEAGVKLFELKSTGQAGSQFGDWVHKLGGSAASLHAKTFAVDANRAFVGSFNFDPRSAELNTEMGFVVQSAALANVLHDGFATKVPQMAYEVRLNAKHKLEWVDRSGAEEKILTTEPETGAFKRGMVKFLSWLPIDWML